MVQRYKDVVKYVTHTPVFISKMLNTSCSTTKLLDTFLDTSLKLSIHTKQTNKQKKAKKISKKKKSESKKVLNEIQAHLVSYTEKNIFNILS